jgi:hypothetical protein
MFNFYPKVFYSINESEKIRAVDITLSARVKKFINSTNGVFLRPYQVKNGERPDIVSTRLYDNPRYEYILLLVNNIQSVYDDWPKDYKTLINYITEKYGSLSYAQSNFAYFYTADDIIVSEEYWQTIPGSSKYRETFYEYELRLNDEKSRISIVDFSYLIQFETGIQELLDTSPE